MCSEEPEPFNTDLDNEAMKGLEKNPGCTSHLTQAWEDAPIKIESLAVSFVIITSKLNFLMKLGASKSYAILWTKRCTSNSAFIF